MSNLIKKENQFLSKLYDNLNTVFFGETLPAVVLTIQGEKAGAKNSLGWFSPNRWRDGEETKHEINITAENFKRPTFSIFITLLHEMIHLQNEIKGIKDTTRQGRYHNKKFANTCHDVGLLVTPCDEVGYRTPHDYNDQSEKVKSFYDSMTQSEKWQEVETLFQLSRMKPQAKEKQQKNNIWLSITCPQCGEVFKVKKTIFETVPAVFCPQCGEIIGGEQEEDK
jgi:ribosomal protein S27E